MRVLFVGLGKLGLPVALALKAAGHDVVGAELSVERIGQILHGQVPEGLQEPYVAEYLRGHSFPVVNSVGQAMRAWTPEVVMIAVQTPHQPQFEGTTPLEEPPQDFDYTHLKTALAEVRAAVKLAGIDPLVVTISTCLPGTYERELKPLVRDLRYAYNPLFIAMGSVVDNFRNPEFILVGVESPLSRVTGQPPQELADLYRRVLDHPRLTFGQYQCMSITSAELTKVAYNAWLGFKLMLANGLAMTAEATGADVDDVMTAIKGADQRIVSTAYMDAGMGDGGSCHPRDMIAMSWLAGRIGLTHDPYGLVVRQREVHAQWLAGLWRHEALVSNLPMVMLGSAYKPNTTIQTGSHALLVVHYARQMAREGAEEEVIRVEDRPFKMDRACYFLATPHDYFCDTPLPAGSVLVDPWGVYPANEGVRLVKPGRRAYDGQASEAGDGASGVREVQLYAHQEDRPTDDIALPLRGEELEGLRGPQGSGEDQ